ncbi:PTS sugar transporter subunit IIC [Dubosiella muris]|uniref:PTS sugar transporter subunit IIC n=1 Tax=Dubosiella muris TaxID=3038133 RepID=A0AC61R711_9FIRM|nr:PTS sugar transporter subunit IIC [Dubosiella muris]TGY65746.1 PTS sugar transporter subunit IIC [Dubosiella muris]
MLIQSILLGLVAMLGNAEYLLGTCLLSRPLIMGTFTGIVLGDIELGVKIGATMELAFMGAFSIGASIPPEMISGTVLGTAFAITTGSGAETALAIGLPVASLVLLAKNFGMVFILPPFVHKADEYAQKDNMQGVATVHYLAGFFGVNLIIGLCVAVGYYLGGPAIEAFLAIIPAWISKGLEITMGLLPAIGFGLLMKMIMNKANVCFFILGFGLSVYLNLPGTGIAVFGAIIAIVLTQIKRTSMLQPAGAQGGMDDDDDF